MILVVVAKSLASRHHFALVIAISPVLILLWLFTSLIRLLGTTLSLDADPVCSCGKTECTASPVELLHSYLAQVPIFAPIARLFVPSPSSSVLSRDSLIHRLGTLASEVQGPSSNMDLQATQLAARSCVSRTAQHRPPYSQYVQAFQPQTPPLARHRIESQPSRTGLHQLQGR